MVPLAILILVELSVLMVVGGYLFPRYFIVVSKTFPSCGFKNKPPNFVSADEDIVFFRMTMMDRIALLCII